MNSTHDIPCASAETETPTEYDNLVTIKGVLKDRSDSSVVLCLDDIDVEIPLCSIVSIDPDLSVPAFQSSLNTSYISVQLIPSASIIIRKELPARALGKGLGLKPFVLHQPTQAAKYATSDVELRKRNAIWFATFKASGALDLRERIPLPVASVYSTTVATSYPSSVGTPVSTTTFPGEGFDEQTDTQLDEIDVQTADYQTDYVEEA
jgi:hypothetical protein